MTSEVRNSCEWSAKIRVADLADGSYYVGERVTIRDHTWSLIFQKRDGKIGACVNASATRPDVPTPEAKVAAGFKPPGNAEFLPLAPVPGGWPSLIAKPIAELTTEGSVVDSCVGITATVGGAGAADGGAGRLHGYCRAGRKTHIIEGAMDIEIGSIAPGVYEVGPSMYGLGCEWNLILAKDGEDRIGISVAFRRLPAYPSGEIPNVILTGEPTVTVGCAAPPPDPPPAVVPRPVPMASGAKVSEKTTVKALTDAGLCVNGKIRLSYRITGTAATRVV